MKTTSTGLVRLEIVQFSHCTLAEITGEASREINPLLDCARVRQTVFAIIV